MLTSDPITGAAANAGWYAVHVNCNDLAAMGAQPIGVLATLLLPGVGRGERRRHPAWPTSTAPPASWGSRCSAATPRLAPGLSTPLIAMTAVGRAPRDRAARLGQRATGPPARPDQGGRPGGDRHPGHRPGRPPGRTGCPPTRWPGPATFSSELSVVPEGLLAAELGAAALHDPTEGGLLGAVWELAEAAGCGFELDLIDRPGPPGDPRHLRRLRRRSAEAHRQRRAAGGRSGRRRPRGRPARRRHRRDRHRPSDRRPRAHRDRRRQPTPGRSGCARRALANPRRMELATAR